MTRAACTKEAIEQAVELKRRGALDKDIAAAIGVTPYTFSRWVNHPKSDNQRQLGQALKKVEAEYKASLLTVIFNAGVKGQWQAAAWILERKYPDEFGRRDRVQAEAKIEAAPAFFFDPKDIDAAEG